jgi:hypothetical protein
MQWRVARSKVRSNSVGRGTSLGSNKPAPAGEKSRTVHPTREFRQIVPSAPTRNRCRGFIRRSMPHCMEETSWRGVTRPLTRGKNQGMILTAAVSRLAGRYPTRGLCGMLEFRHRFDTVGATQPSASGFSGDTERGFPRRLIICSLFCRPSGEFVVVLSDLPALRASTQDRQPDRHIRDAAFAGRASARRYSPMPKLPWP